MHLYFIRHAQSKNNALAANTGSDFGRSEDPELTEIGLEQARRLAEFLRTGDPRGGYITEDGSPAGFGITHLYSSLMVRAATTGHLVAEALDLPLHAWIDIHEEGGIYLADEETGEPMGRPGYNRAYFEESFPKMVLPDTLGEDGWWHGRPQEPVEERLPRARRVLQELLERHGGTDDRVAFISHGGFYNLFVSILLGLPSRDGVWFTMNNAAITRFVFMQEQAAIDYQNRMDFLPDDLVT